MKQEIWRVPLPDTPGLPVDFVTHFGAGSVRRHQEKPSVRKYFIVELIVFVLILIALNFFFHLHISIIGSVVITLVIAVMMGAMRRRQNPSP